MTAESHSDPSHRLRRLYVAWQDPESRAIEPVATLVQEASSRTTRYLFSYLRRIHSLDRFRPFTAFPETNHLYESETLFPFFANRILARRRSDYGRMMALLDLQLEAEPFEILARSGARRATDHLEVFPEPEMDPRRGEGSCLFFVRGLRYVPGAEQAIDNLAVGDRLRPLLDVQNEANLQVVLLTDNGQHLLGYVPDYLTAHLQTMIRACSPSAVRVVVEHVNSLDSPRHMRLLCRLTTCWPTGYRPFTDVGFEPLAQGIPGPSVEHVTEEWGVAQDESVLDIDTGKSIGGSFRSVSRLAASP